MKIASIVVAYKPDVDHLLNLCRALKASGSAVYVVDNTEGTDSGLCSQDLWTLIPLGRNMGIAYAQNVGIEQAKKDGADVIVFFDQDSAVDPSFLATLVAPLNTSKLMVVAPVCIDARTGQEMPAVVLGRFGMPRKVYAARSGMPVPVDLVIASGSAAAVKVFEAVGLMKEELFIDYVDFEWCLRCRRHGIPICVVPQARMRHEIGQTAINFHLFSGVVHSSARTYYKLRNSFLLLRNSHIPKLFAIREILAAIVSQIAVLPFLEGKKNYLTVFVRAIWHGIVGVSGRDPRQSANLRC